MQPFLLRFFKKFYTKKYFYTSDEYFKYILDRLFVITKQIYKNMFK